MSCQGGTLETHRYIHNFALFIYVWQLPSILSGCSLSKHSNTNRSELFKRKKGIKGSCLYTISYISLASSDQINSTWLILTFLSCFFRPHRRRSATTATASKFCPGKHVNNDDHEFQEINQYDPVTSGRRRTGKNIFLIYIIYIILFLRGTQRDGGHCWRHIFFLVTQSRFFFVNS